MANPDTSMARHFASLPDPRSDHGKRYSLTALVTIAICAVVCGAEDWVGVAGFGRVKERWFRTFLDLPDDTPSDDTFRRVFSLLDPDAFERCFQSWTTALAGLLCGVVSLDGKALRRSFDAASGKAAIHMVSAWACECGLVFGQVAVDEKSNEITALPKLIEMLDIKGLTVTIDAAGCQKGMIEKIVDKGGDYVLAVKDNQPTLHEDVKGIFADAAKHGWKGRGHDVHTEADKGHGRIEQRTTTITWDVPWLFGAWEKSGWKGVRCLVEVRRERTIGEKSSASVHHYIAGVDTRKASRMAEIIRAHWGVENQLHWRLDVSFTRTSADSAKATAPRTCPASAASGSTSSNATSPRRWASRTNASSQDGITTTSSNSWKGDNAVALSTPPPLHPPRLPHHLQSPMPTYEYEILNPKGEPTGERFEHVQSMKEAALTRHPETGKPCRRAIVAPAIAGKWSPIKEKSTLSNKNLERMGFTKYERKGKGYMERTAGKEGPKSISAED